MRVIKPWLSFSERLLNYKYPKSLVDVDAVTFIKKFITDYAPIAILFTAVLFILLGPTEHPDNMDVFLRIFFGTGITIFIFDLSVVCAAKGLSYLRRRK